AGRREPGPLERPPPGRNLGDTLGAPPLAEILRGWHLIADADRYAEHALAVRCLGRLGNLGLDIARRLHVVGKLCGDGGRHRLSPPRRDARLSPTRGGVA